MELVIGAQGYVCEVESHEDGAISATLRDANGHAVAIGMARPGETPEATVAGGPWPQPEPQAAGPRMRGDGLLWERRPA
jgi:hypothetical protein